MRILIIVPAQDTATGNRVSAERFRSSLATLGHEVLVQETGLSPAPGLRSAIDMFKPDVALLLHAYRSGKPWLELMLSGKLPVVVLLTGTDVTLGMDDPSQQTTIRAIFSSASAILLQNRRLLGELAGRCSSLAGKLHYLPPGIQLGSAPFALRARLGIAPDTLLFFCPAGIRPVKGVLELLELFDPLPKQTEHFHLAFAGPVLDETYARQFCEAVAERPWASYLGTIAPAAMPAAMRDADVILNNSLAEGLSNALLEATVLGIPVLAHDIPGNAEIIVHGQNGLLYGDSDDFRRLARQLIEDPALRKRLGTPHPRSFDPALECQVLEGYLRNAWQLRHKQDFP